MDLDQARLGFTVLDNTMNILKKEGYIAKKTPKVTFDKTNGLYFTQKAIRAINDTFGGPAQYAKVCVNEETKQISVEPVAEKEPGARAFMAGKEKQKNLIIRWSDDSLMGIIEKMLPDKEVDRVVIPMRYDEDAKWHVIEVGEATESTRKRSKA